MDDSPVETLQTVTPYLCIGHTGEDTLPLSCWCLGRRPASDYPTALCCGSYGILPHPPPLLIWQSCPPWKHPSASADPTRSAWKPLSQSFILLVICALISLALRTPNVFETTTWAKKGVYQSYRDYLRTPCHSAATISINWRLTALEGVAYQLADCADSRCQRHFQI